MVLVAQVHSLVLQFTLIELWCMTNWYIGSGILTTGEPRGDVNVLLLPIKVNSNHCDAISKVADQSHFAKLLQTDIHGQELIMPNEASAQE